MRKPGLRTIGAAIILLGVLGASVAFLSSFRFNPDPSGDSDFIARAQQKSVPGIKVNISVLSALESQRSFSETLAIPALMRETYPGKSMSDRLPQIRCNEDSHIPSTVVKINPVGSYLFPG
jgi:hypothetical protein